MTAREKVNDCDAGLDSHRGTYVSVMSGLDSHRGTYVSVTSGCAERKTSLWESQT